MSVVTQLKRSWRAELPVLDIIRIPPAANSSGGCTRATRASATASTRVSPLFADFCSQILPTVVLHQREANASHYTRCPLPNSEFRRAAPSEFAKLPPPDGTRCAIIRGSVEPWRFIVPRFPHSARMKSSQETFGWRDMREREKKGRGEESKPDTKPSNWKENANVQTFLPLSIFPTIYASLFKTGRYEWLRR